MEDRLQSKRRCKGLRARGAIPRGPVSAGAGPSSPRVAWIVAKRWAAPTHPDEMLVRLHSTPVDHLAETPPLAAGVTRSPGLLLRGRRGVLRFLLLVQALLLRVARR